MPQDMPMTKNALSDRPRSHQGVCGGGEEGTWGGEGGRTGDVWVSPVVRVPPPQPPRLLKPLALHSRGSGITEARGTIQRRASYERGCK
eukprot:255027-Chlamydomonas_euryale.AAC.1